MENKNLILDDDKEDSYATILRNERRKKFFFFCIVFGLILGIYLVQMIDVKFFSGLMLFGGIFALLEITRWQAIYHISFYNDCITLYLLDFFGRKNEIDLQDKDIQKIKLNPSFNSIQIPQYYLKMPLQEKKFKTLVSLIENLNSKN